MTAYGFDRTIARITIGLAAALASAVMVTSAGAQDAVQKFYKDKQVTFYVGFAPGGGYDAYARMLARHMGKYLPGSPGFLVKNMFGAAGEVAAAYVARIAPKDGTAIAGVAASQPLNRIFIPTNKQSYDPAKQHYLGSAASDIFVCMVRKDAPVKTAKDLFEKELIIGSGAPRSGTLSFMPNMEQNLLGTKMRLILGYKGSRAIVGAMEKGEVHGLCGINLSTIRAQYPHYLSTGLAHILVQESVDGDPELNAANIPKMYDFAKTDEHRKIMRTIYAQGKFARPFFVADGVPAERVAALRKAFLDSLKDKSLLAEAAKQVLSIEPIPGSAIQQIVAEIAKEPESFIDAAKASVNLK